MREHLKRLVTISLMLFSGTKQAATEFIDNGVCISCDESLQQSLEDTTFFKRENTLTCKNYDNPLSLPGMINIHHLSTTNNRNIAPLNILRNLTYFYNYCISEITKRKESSTQDSIIDIFDKYEEGCYAKHQDMAEISSCVEKAILDGLKTSEQLQALINSYKGAYQRWLKSFYCEPKKESDRSVYSTLHKHFIVSAQSTYSTSAPQDKAPSTSYDQILNSLHARNAEKNEQNEKERITELATKAAKLKYGKS